MKIPISDIHMHPGLKGYADKKENPSNCHSIWDYYPPKEEAIKELNVFVRDVIRELAKDSQAHLTACAEARLAAPFIAIYPVERQMFHIQPRKPFKLLLNLILPKKKYVDLGTAVSGFPKSLVKKILDNNVFDKSNDGINYFKEYLAERDYILEQTKITCPDIPAFRFRIASNFSEFEQYTQDENTICGILTVEGAHSFGHYLYDSTFLQTPETLLDDERNTLEGSIIPNIKTVKTENAGRFAPFFVTFCHHFNNLLGGHSRSMSAPSNLLPFLNWPNLPGMRHLFNQEAFLGEGLSDLGRRVLELLLDKEQGRRILIDIKHMSIKVRREYFAFVEKQREAGDNIPIICSHAAVSGWPTLSEAAQQPEAEGIDKDAFFSRWQINLTDEDILAVFDSNGIIGLLLHEGRMPGEAFKRAAKKLKKTCEKFRKRDQKKVDEALSQLKDLYLQLLWSNIFHIVRVIRLHRQADGWTMLALGSDYDGLVDPFNTYRDVFAFPHLYTDLLAYLKAGKPVFRADRGKAAPLSPDEIRDLIMEKDPEQLLQNFFFGNVRRFLSEYFTDQYLQSHSRQAPVSA